MAERPSPNRLLILWSMPDEYERAVAPARAQLYLSVKLEAEVALPADEPPSAPPPTADEVPIMPSTQAAFEVMQGIDQLLGDADEFIPKAKESRGAERLPVQGAPLRVEYRVTLRAGVQDRGVPVEFGVGVVDTVDRAALLPRFLVVPDDRRAGESRDEPARPGGPGATFFLSMIDYCAVLDDLRRIVDEWKEAADLPLPDGWFAGTRAHALITGRIAAHPALAAALGARR